MLRLMDRSKPKGASQLTATFFTFVASSVWHGTYPGFIIFFVGIAMLEIQSKGFPRTKLALQVQKVVPWQFITAICYVWYFFNMAYFGLAFQFLTFEKSHIMYTNLGYLLHYLCPIVTLLAIYLPKQRIEKPK
jgi:MBOAT, membrane-bound O-acyltransferase family